MNIESFLVGFVVALLVMLPFGGRCLWASYRLGRRLRLTDSLATIALGAGLFLPLTVAFMVVLYVVLNLLHLPHDGQAVAGGIGVGGWMGAWAARVENLKQLENPKQQGR